MLLIAQGLLERRPKKGTFVRELTPEEAFHNAPIVVAGLTPESWSGDYAGPLMKSLIAHLPDHDWIFLHLRNPDDIALRLRSLHSPFLLAVTPHVDEVPALEQLAISGVQVLCLGARVASTRLHYIAVDNAGGISAGLRYLAQLGHRRIAYLGHHADYFDHIERVKAFKQARGHLGLDRSAELVVWRENPHELQLLVDQALDHWYSLPAPPTAIVSSGCALTLPLMQALGERGLRYPDDVSLLAFDDLAVASHLAVPLTVIRQPLRDMGRRAAKAMELLCDPAHAHIQEVRPVDLIIRASCAPPRG